MFITVEQRQLTRNTIVTVTSRTPARIKCTRAPLEHATKQEIDASECRRLILAVYGAPAVWRREVFAIYLRRQFDIGRQRIADVGKTVQVVLLISDEI